MLKLVDLTAIRRAFAEHEQSLADEFGDQHPLSHWDEIRAHLSGPPGDPHKYQRWTEDTLREARAGRGFRRRLAKQWGVSQEAVKKRLRRLRNESWILGDSSRVLPGHTYLSWLHANEGEINEGAANDQNS